MKNSSFGFGGMLVHFDERIGFFVYVNGERFDFKDKDECRKFIRQLNIKSN